MITVSRELLKPEGVFCLHLDWRMSAQGRVLCDRLFGKERFLNEIIWSYESGGRSKKCFLPEARYHSDVRPERKVPLRPDQSAAAPGRAPEKPYGPGNRRDGAQLFQHRVRGKEYRYYDDEPVYPGDVWTDIGFLQQKDPERTGYPTQKPEKLLERLMKPVVQPGDRVADLCCGSGTTLAAAEKLGCLYAGLDACPEAIAVCQARLKAENLTVICATSGGPGPAERGLRPGSGAAADGRAGPGGGNLSGKRGSRGIWWRPGKSGVPKRTSSGRNADISEASSIRR